jgi:heat-inducible transcriptional repressor
MSQLPQIGARGREILTAIVDTFIATGEPVGSRTLAQQSRENLSPATVRNVMADLVDAGYLEQPHTSAGRVPTALAFRYYVNQLTGNTRLSPAHEDLIRGTLQGTSGVQEFMERTSHVLSLVSAGVGVAMTGTGPLNALDHLYFSRLGDHKVLAVVVTKSGLVHDRVFRLESDLPQHELDLAARYLNENFHGWTMQALREEVERQVEQHRSEYDRLMASIEQLYKQGALATHAGRNVYVDGASNLLVADQDKERLRELLRALEEKEKVAKLLNAYLDAQQENVRVVIGLELAMPDLRNFVLIGAPAHVGNEVIGSLAVIGPTRIDYQHTIAAVSCIARLFDQLLSTEGQQ